MPRAKTAPSAALLCYVNSRLYGQVTGVSLRSVVTRRRVHGIDTTEAQELTSGPTKIGGTIRVIRVIGDGGAEGAGMTTNFENLPAEQYFSLLILERGFGTVMFRADQCSLLGQTWDMPSKGLVSGTLEFEALTWSNETLNP